MVNQPGLDINDQRAVNGDAKRSTGLYLLCVYLRKTVRQMDI